MKTPQKINEEVMEILEKNFQGQDKFLSNAQLFLDGNRTQAELRRRRPSITKVAAKEIAKAANEAYAQVIAARQNKFDQEFGREGFDKAPEQNKWTKAKFWTEDFRQYEATTQVKRYNTPIFVHFLSDHTGTSVKIGGDAKPSAYHMDYVTTPAKPEWHAVWQTANDPTPEELSIITDALEKVGPPPAQKKEPLTLEQRVERIEKILGNQTGSGALLAALRKDLV